MISFSRILVFTFLFISVLKFNAKAEVHPEIQKLIPGNLIDQNFNQVDSENLEEKIIGLYFSAGWCPPCRTFSPTLKEFREQNKEDFEVVMVSADRNIDEQLQYMQSTKMPWPALPFDSPLITSLAERYAAEAVPHLVLLNAEGDLITEDGVRG